MSNVKLVGIDIAKSIFQLYGATKKGDMVFNKRIKRGRLMEFISQLPTGCSIFMEACGSSNHWARQFSSMGFDVRLISPRFVKPYVRGNKNDSKDARAIVLAALEPAMRFVPAKTLEQQDMQSLHRARELEVKNRTALANQIRGLLAEYGVILPQGVRNIRTKLLDVLEDTTNELTAKAREIIGRLSERFRDSDSQVKHYDGEMKRVACNDERCQRLQKLPGIGPITATAMVSAIGEGREFKRGRELAAWLGLTPRHRASGTKMTMLGISKRGNSYLRKILVQGSRTVVMRCHSKQDARNRWIARKVESRGTPKAVIALANKMAREIWAVLAKGELFEFTSFNADANN